MNISLQRQRIYKLKRLKETYQSRIKNFLVKHTMRANYYGTGQIQQDVRSSLVNETLKLKLL